MDISEVDLDEHCYLNTVKGRKTIFSILDQKRAEAVRILQEMMWLPIRQRLQSRIVMQLH